MMELAAVYERLESCRPEGGRAARVEPRRQQGGRDELREGGGAAREGRCPCARRTCRGTRPRQRLWEARARPGSRPPSGRDQHASLREGARHPGGCCFQSALRPRCHPGPRLRIIGFSPPCTTRSASPRRLWRPLERRLASSAASRRRIPATKRIVGKAASLSETSDRASPRPRALRSSRRLSKPPKSCFGETP